MSLWVEFFFGEKAQVDTKPLFPPLLLDGVEAGTESRNGKGGIDFVEEDCRLIFRGLSLHSFLLLVAVRNGGWELPVVGGWSRGQERKFHTNDKQAQQLNLGLTC